MPVYDSESMGIAARRVAKLRDEFDKSKGKVMPVEGEHNPFGSMGGSEDVKGALGGFQTGVHSEFEAGGQLMTSLSDALLRAAGLIAENDQASGEAIARQQRQA
ncbi:hypothetical protein [Amycolatopsis sp. 195334CR]|uniref:hypothetical protein n=1 Tax=Amycolatopsis sp. 195334CR TaxID=2814588 RepID=UPI001A8C6BAD|nr:hypothetical protein [Amycolatopsis sp. 195334CR]MBN6035857.1 hypothetical protein [Amycolatopsis sp. 195334CR]